MQMVNCASWKSNLFSLWSRSPFFNASKKKWRNAITLMWQNLYPPKKRFVTILRAFVLFFNLYFSCKQVCSEMFHKSCQITFRKSSAKEKVKKCHFPTEKVCNGNGPDRCSTVYETSCTSRYIDKSGNGTQFVGDTNCQKIPNKICGKGCITRPGKEECHENQVRNSISIALCFKNTFW